MPSRWPGSNASSRSIRERSWPSPTTATSSTTSPSGFLNSIVARAFRGRATTRRWLEQKQQRLAQEEKAGERSASETLQARTRVGPNMSAARAAGQVARRVLSAYEAAARRGPGEEVRGAAPRSTIPIPGPRLGDKVIDATSLAQGVRRSSLLFDGPLDSTLPPGGIVGVIGPNGAGKTTLFRMITRGQEKPDEGSLRNRTRRVHLALRGPVARRPRSGPQTCGEEITDGRRRAAVSGTS